MTYLFTPISIGLADTIGIIATPMEVSQSVVARIEALREATSVRVKPAAIRAFQSAATPVNSSSNASGDWANRQPLVSGESW